MSNTQNCNRVLVAEDDYWLRTLFATVLNKAGFHVSLAANGPEVMDNLHGEVLPNVLLLDIGLPQISGLVILQQMRSLPGADQIRTIALTGYPLYEQTVEAKLADVFLMKPVSPGDLVAFVQRLMPTDEHPIGRLDYQ